MASRFLVKWKGQRKGVNPIVCGIRDIVGNKAAESAPTLILCDLGTVLLSFSDKGVNALGLRNVAIELRSRLSWS